ncbi:MAG: hypothetical protein ACRDBM_14010, partial [Sporomusa sp.]
MSRLAGRKRLLKSSELVSAKLNIGGSGGESTPSELKPPIEAGFLILCLRIKSSSSSKGELLLFVCLL